MSLFHSASLIRNTNLKETKHSVWLSNKHSQQSANRFILHHPAIGKKLQSRTAD